MLTRVRVVGVVTHVNNHANSANSPHHPLYSPHNRTSHDNQPDNQDVEDQWCVTRYPGLRKKTNVFVEKVIILYLPTLPLFEGCQRVSLSLRQLVINIDMMVHYWQ